MSSLQLGAITGKTSGDLSKEENTATPCLGQGEMVTPESDIKVSSEERPSSATPSIQPSSDQTIIVSTLAQQCNDPLTKAEPLARDYPVAREMSEDNEMILEPISDDSLLTEKEVFGTNKMILEPISDDSLSKDQDLFTNETHLHMTPSDAESSLLMKSTTLAEKIVEAKAIAPLIEMDVEMKDFTNEKNINEKSDKEKLLSPPVVERKEPIPVSQEISTPISSEHSTINIDNTNDIEDDSLLVDNDDNILDEECSVSSTELLKESAADLSDDEGKYTEELEEVANLDFEVTSTAEVRETGMAVDQNCLDQALANEQSSQQDLEFSKDECTAKPDEAATLDFKVTCATEFKDKETEEDQACLEQVLSDKQNDRQDLEFREDKGTANPDKAATLDFKATCATEVKEKETEEDQACLEQVLSIKQSDRQGLELIKDIYIGTSGGLETDESMVCAQSLEEDNKSMLDDRPETVCNSQRSPLSHKSLVSVIGNAEYKSPDELQMVDSESQVALKVGSRSFGEINKVGVESVDISVTKDSIKPKSPATNRSLDDRVISIDNSVVLKSNIEFQQHIEGEEVTASLPKVSPQEGIGLCDKPVMGNLHDQAIDNVQGGCWKFKEHSLENVEVTPQPCYLPSEKNSSFEDNALSTVVTKDVAVNDCTLDSHHKSTALEPTNSDETTAVSTKSLVEKGSSLQEEFQRGVLDEELKPRNTPSEINLMTKEQESVNIGGEIVSLHDLSSGEDQLTLQNKKNPEGFNQEMANVDNSTESSVDIESQDSIVKHSEIMLPPHNFSTEVCSMENQDDVQMKEVDENTTVSDSLPQVCTYTKEQDSAANEKDSGSSLNLPTEDDMVNSQDNLRVIEGISDQSEQHGKSDNINTMLNIEDIASDEESKEESVVEIFIQENGKAFTKCGGEIQTLGAVDEVITGSLLDEPGIDSIIVEEKIDIEGSLELDSSCIEEEREKKDKVAPDHNIHKLSTGVHEASHESYESQLLDVSPNVTLIDHAMFEGDIVRAASKSGESVKLVAQTICDRNSINEALQVPKPRTTFEGNVVSVTPLTEALQNHTEGNEQILQVLVNREEKVQKDNLVVTDKATEQKGNSENRQELLKDESMDIDVCGVSPPHAANEDQMEGSIGNAIDKSKEDEEDEEVTITGVCRPDSSDKNTKAPTSKDIFGPSLELFGLRIPPPPPKPEKPLTPYLRYKKKVLSNVRKEFPRLNDRLLNLVISNQWNMIKEEEKLEYSEEFAQEKQEYHSQLTRYYSSPEYKSWLEAKDTALPCRVQLSKLSDSATPEMTPEELSKKTGQCNWCKNFATLNNFSANLQGKEIYCTGLCSQKCFKEASMKICNLENSGTAFSKPGSNGSSQADDSSSTGEPSPVLLNPGTSSPTPSNTLGNFVWQQYLKECNAVAAPWQYFCQSQKPLQNAFVRGMKLEAKDPRQDEAVCVATVVAILGPRLRLRFDGSDTTNDIWRLVDSDDIHPIGWAEKNGAMLHPPVGFRWDVGKFPEFLTKTLNEAMVANADLFVQPPPTPTENLFQLGMKLEAVDRANSVLICVASVIDVKDSRIHVEFDGYKGSGYWCHHSDRDVFPPGWCFNNGYPLQPPGKKAYQALSKEKALPSLLSSRPVTRTNGDSSNKNTSGMVFDTKESRSPVPVAPSSTDSDLRQHLLNVIVYLNADCLPGPYINKSKLAKLPKYYNGKGVIVMQTVIEDIISCAYNPKVVFGFLRPVARKTNCVITAHFDGVQYRCCLPNIEHMSLFWKTLEQFVDNLRCCENLLSATTVPAPCAKCAKGTSFSVLASSNKRPAAPPVVTSASTHQYGGQPISTRFGVDGNQGILTAVNSNGVNGDAPHMKRTKLDSSPIEINKPPRLWSIDEVAKFIEQTDIREHANVFKMNEIDGKALLLLKREIVINYMGFKLGPAVKLLEIVDELREIQRNI